MIRKLKFRFILLSMTTLVLLLTTILIGMNVINYSSVVREADQTLQILSQNRGAFPEPEDKPNITLPPHMSPETPYESRFFSVVLNTDGDAIDVDTSKIIAIDEQTATSYAKEAIRESDAGFINNFRYIVTEEFDEFRVTFLDCGRTLDAFYNFLWASLFMAIVGLIIVFVVIFFISGRIIKPIAESYAKQKQFITDAGHEIKTPLTIINANVDILEMELGEENESLSDIKNQALRLRDLTNELVMLARLEEVEAPSQKIDFPISEVVTEATRPFYTLAQSQGRSLSCAIQPMLSLCGNDRSIVQLVTLLLDNAVKYSSDNSEIALSLARQGHSVVLSVSNTVEQALAPEHLDRIFDRFYKTDASRNSEVGGHGIGLSIARAIVVAHGGKISASSPDERTFRISAVFPA